MQRESAADDEERLVATLERQWAETARAAGAWLACRPGCTECCIGPFPVTRLDAAWLRCGLARLRSSRPQAASRVLERARRAATTLREDFPGDAATGRLGDDEARLDVFLERHAALPCPVLDPATGRCELYDARPVACRVYGPPVRYASGDGDACRLCFVGADAATVERCRVAPDPEGLEETILARTPGGEAETLVAFALLEADPIE